MAIAFGHRSIARAIVKIPTFEIQGILARSNSRQDHAGAFTVVVGSLTGI